MIKSKLIRYSLVAVLLTSLTTPVMARPGGGPGGPDPTPPPSHHRSEYGLNGLPAAASFLVLSGITYALIDGLYYQKQNDRYVYVQNPPTSTTVTTTTTSSNIGQVVDALPSGSKTVTVNGVLYYVSGNTWYAPIASSSKFVTVAPQL